MTIGARGIGAGPVGGAADALRELLAPTSALAKRLRASERAVLIWSGPGGGGGARLAEAAHALGFAGKPGCAAFHLPATPNARGVAEAWAAAADGDEVDPERIALLIVSGDEAAASPGVRALAERADAVIAITMFHWLAVGWADLVLPATAALEREGTTMNLEGRVQRQRRAVIAPVPDELAWIAKLAARFDIELSPHAAVVFEELSERLYGGLTLEQLGEHAPLPARSPYQAPEPAPARARRNGGRRRTGTSSARCACSATRRCSRATRSSGSPSSSSSGPTRRSRCRRRTPTAAASRPATWSRCARTAPRSSFARGSTAARRRRRARRRRARRRPPRRVEVVKA